MILKLSASFVFLLLFAFVSFSVASAEDVSTTVASKSSNISTASTLAPVTSEPPSEPSKTCEQRKNSSCSSCTDDGKCYWCSVDSTCKAYVASKIIPRDCKGNKWYWKQCFVEGFVLIIVIPSLCGVILLSFGCCIYCCCCRSKGRKGYDREDERIRRRKQEANERNAKRRADRQARSDAIRQKYGLLRNEDNDNEVV